jgi:hypothetical protein
MKTIRDRGSAKRQKRLAAKQAAQKNSYKSVACGMKHEEWDWPPTRRRYRAYPRHFDVYQPSGWNSPGVKKAIHIYWRVMITIIKVLLAIPLSIMIIGGLWLLWTIITL